MEAMECDVSNSVNGQSPSEQNQDNQSYPQGGNEQF